MSATIATTGNDIAKCTSFADQAWPTLVTHFDRIDAIGNGDPATHSDAQLIHAVFNTIKAELIMRYGVAQ